jgi:hypothetical protein
LLHSALDQQLLGAAFRLGKTEFDSFYGNLTNRIGPVEFEAIIEKRWDSRGRKTNNPDFRRVGRVANVGISLLKATIAFGRGCQLKSLLLRVSLRSEQEEQTGRAETHAAAAAAYAASLLESFEIPREDITVHEAAARYQALLEGGRRRW